MTNEQVTFAQEHLHPHLMEWFSAYILVGIPADDSGDGAIIECLGPEDVVAIEDQILAHAALILKKRRAASARRRRAQGKNGHTPL